MPAETVIEDRRWSEAGLAPLAEAAAEATLRRLHLDPDAFEIAVLGCDNGRIAELNAAFRGKAATTNVLSWPSQERAPAAPGTAPPPPDPDAGRELGDIAIAFETCRREAETQGKRFEDHVTHLLVHGVLHLLGYDHTTARDAALMEGLERQILATLGVADPYYRSGAGNAP